MLEKSHALYEMERYEEAFNLIPKGLDYLGYTTLDEYINQSNTPSVEESSEGNPLLENEDDDLDDEKTDEDSDVEDDEDAKLDIYSRQNHRLLKPYVLSLGKRYDSSEMAQRIVEIFEWMKNHPKKVENWGKIAEKLRFD